MKLLRILCLCALTALPACAQTTNAPRMRGVISWDTNALAFFTRAGITNLHEKTRINNLVTDLKAANLWTNFYALYPFVGSASNSCAQNLVSTNFSITWNGAVAFSRSGVTGDGVSANGDTGFIESTTGANTNNLHIYAYAVDVLAGASGTYIGSSQTNAWGAIGETFGSFAGMNLNAQDTPTQLSYIATGHLLASRQSTNQAFLLAWPSFISTNIVADQQYVSNNVVTTGVITNSMKLLYDPAMGTGVYLQGATKTTLGAASFGAYLSYNQATNYFRIMSRYIDSRMKLDGFPNPDAPILRSSAVSNPTTNAPRHRN
jgi:hypothetical protein